MANAGKFIGWDGRVREWVARANMKSDREVRAGLRCSACGRAFSPKVPKAANPMHAGACEECSRSLD